MSESHMIAFLQENATLVSVVAVTAGAVFYYLLRRSYSHHLPMSAISLENQSAETEPGCRQSLLLKDGKLVTHFFDDAKTCHEAFLRGMRVSNDGPCLGVRSGPKLEFEWLSFKQVYDKAQMLGSAFIQRGMTTGNENMIGIFANNCPEWVITEQACNMYSMVSVPLYDTLGIEACSYIMNQASIEIIMVDKADKVEKILISNSTPSLRIIVHLADIPDSVKERAKEINVELISWNDMLDIGSGNLANPFPPKPDDLITICYTSGTTGNPKGVMLTHGNLIANVASVANLLPEEGILATDRHLSYLPLAHMFERATQVLMYIHGARIGFFRGDIKLLTEDMQALKPTIFPTVPRLMNRIYDKVMMGIKDSKVKQMLFNLAMNRKEAMIKKGIRTNNSIWDKLVFHKIQNLMGGSVRYCIVGSAPLASHVLHFAKCAFGCTVAEGYGQTETTAGISATLAYDYKVGSVGPPLDCNFVKLVDVSEMDYYVKDNKGEVCVKGTNTMKGYYKDPEKTKETIDEDGWIHTGDIGQFLEDGTLKIIDRKKHIFKLAQGEYIAPEKIEGVYTGSSLVAQAFVDGNSLSTYPVAVLVPDPETLPIWANKEGITGTMEELCASEKVKKAVFDDCIKTGKAFGLKGFEQIKQCHLNPELFSVENGFLTPTFKAKRPQLRKHFSSKLEELYKLPPM